MTLSSKFSLFFSIVVAFVAAETNWAWGGVQVSVDGDAELAANYTVQLPHSTLPTPLATALKRYTVTSGRDLFVKRSQLSSAAPDASTPSGGACHTRSSTYKVSSSRGVRASFLDVRPSRESYDSRL